MNRKDAGFTLIELMVTLVVAGILLAIGIPSFSSLFARNRLTTQANEMLSAMSYARSEAIKRGIPVSLCRSASPNTPGLALNQWVCRGDTVGWEGGWLIYADANNNNTADAGEQLRGKPAIGGSNTLRGNGVMATRVTFTAQGSAIGTNGTMTLCDTKYTTETRYLVLAVSGRALSTKNPASRVGLVTCP